MLVGCLGIAIYWLCGQIVFTSYLYLEFNFQLLTLTWPNIRSYNFLRRKLATSFKRLFFDFLPRDVFTRYFSSYSLASKVVCSFK